MLNTVIKQILNRKKSNVWITLELLLVFCFLWYMVDYFFVLAYNHSIPSHRNVENTYKLDLSQLSDLHPDYKPDDDAPLTLIDNFYRVINRIRLYPEVETVGLSFDAVPGGGSFRGGTIYSLEDTTRMISSAQVYAIVPEEDYLKVFHYTTDNGRKPVSVKDYDWSEPNGVIITRMVEELLFPGGSATGKIIGDYSKSPLRIIDVVDNVKRSDRNRPYPCYIIPQRITDANVKYVEVVVRTKGNLSSADFTEQFRRDLSPELRIGNFYLKNITSVRKIGEGNDLGFGYTTTNRIRAGLMLFFMVNILLCVIGTFWYRINSRREEIGIRRVMGATRQSIFNQLNMEGLCLLALITLPAILIEMQFIYADMIETPGRDQFSSISYLPDRTVLRFIITNILTWLIMAGIVIAGIWFPARAASRIAPVDALRSE